jgi:hypothetical protein
MDIVYNITLNPTTTPGPFNIYKNAIDPANIVDNNITKTQLLSGYEITVPDDTEFIFLENLANGCNNAIKIEIE